MSNSIRVSLVFSFKGETLSPSAVLDLDALASLETAPDFHSLLARQAGIDTYSYAFEVMQQAELHFSEASGLAVAYLHDDRFDFTGFAAAYRQSGPSYHLQEIASRVLAIDNLDDHPEIREALLQAYQLGQRS